MRVNILFLATIFAVIFFVANPSFAENNWIQIAPVTPTSLNHFIKETGLFTQSHPPKMKKTVQFSIEAGTNKHYSIYTMEPLQSYGKVTRYKTTEKVPEGYRFSGVYFGDTAIVHGKGLSLGGIFWPKESMIVYGRNGRIVYHNKIDVTAIKPISGHLFPLKVGNKLVFAFKRIHSRDVNGRKTVKHEIGTMTYKVINKINHFSFSDKTIPGPIYEIEVWESTNLHRRPYLTDIYQYSAGFNWYISDKYYTKSNRLIAWYRVKNWH